MLEKLFVRKDQVEEAGNAHDRLSIPFIWYVGNEIYSIKLLGCSAPIRDL